MTRTSRGRGLSARKSDNNKRSLLDDPPAALIEDLLRRATYEPSSKHKRHPHLYGLEPFRGNRSDGTMCDQHAEFKPAQVRTIPRLLRRGIQAGLIGHDERVIWTVGDDGWIYEGRKTNPARLEFHGYPLRHGEPIVTPVWRRFTAWADRNGSPVDRTAAVECGYRYGVR